MNTKLLDAIVNLTQSLTSRDQFDAMMDVIEAANLEPREGETAVEAWKISSAHISPLPATIVERRRAAED